MAISKEIKSNLIRDFAQNPSDTGSVEVQVALLTEDIRMLTEHFKAHPKDNSSKRGLLMKVSRRKRLLQYLQRHARAQYDEITKRLGLKK